MALAAGRDGCQAVLGVLVCRKIYQMLEPIARRSNNLEHHPTIPIRKYFPDAAVI